ncbi:MAG: response regulator [Thermodesulfobacteriota bacterium]
MGKVLIIDDDELFCEMLSEMVTDMGHGVKFTQSLSDGVREASNGSYDVVFLDVRLPDGSGLRALPKIRELGDPPEVIIITGAGDPDGAELAMVNGAWDYIEKHSSIKRMTLPLMRALQYRREKRAPKPAVPAAVSVTVNLPRLRDYREAAVAQAEKEYLQELMARAQNDLQEACRISDLSQPRLYALLKKHRVHRPKAASKK